MIEKMEAQAWICLYNLLSTREVAAFVLFVTYFDAKRVKLFHKFFDAYVNAR